MSETYLNPGIPAPMPMGDGLDKAYWEGLAQEKLVLQKCGDCHHWQWGPEWICHQCLSFNIGWEETPPKGRIHSWERNWHPAHPAVKEQGPYLVILVELPGADNVRVVGNLLGDPMQDVPIGAEVEGVFEHHRDAEPPFTLLQWKLAG